MEKKIILDAFDEYYADLWSGMNEPEVTEDMENKQILMDSLYEVFDEYYELGYSDLELSSYIMDQLDGFVEDIDKVVKKIIEW